MDQNTEDPTKLVDSGIHRTLLDHPPTNRLRLIGPSPEVVTNHSSKTTPNDRELFLDIPGNAI